MRQRANNTYKQKPVNYKEGYIHNKQQYTEIIPIMRVKLHNTQSHDWKLSYTTRGINGLLLSDMQNAAHLAYALSTNNNRTSRTNDSISALLALLPIIHVWTLLCWNAPNIALSTLINHTNKLFC